MLRVRRNQHNSNYQAQDGEREDTAVKPEIPGPQASSSLSPPAGKASQGTTPGQLTPVPLQPNPRSSLSEPWNPHKNVSLSSLRIIYSGAMSPTPEPPTTSIKPPGRVAPLVSRLHQYQNYGRTNKVETLVTNKTIKSTALEEEKEEEESSSASTGLSHHPDPKTTVPPVGSLSPLERSRIFRIEELKRESAGTGRSTHTDWTLSLKGNVQGKSTAVALEEDRCAADMRQSSDELRVRRPDGLNVGDPEEDAPTAQFLKECCDRIVRTVQQRLSERISSKEKDEGFCRICHGTDNSPTNPLTSPCRCKGSLKFIHIDCLKNWTRARIEMGVGIYGVQRCELCKGCMILDPGALNIKDFFTETEQQMLNDPVRYPLLAYLHRPPRFQRFLLRVRRWMTFRRSS